MIQVSINLFNLLIVFSSLFKPVVVTKEEFIEYYTYQRATMYPSDDYMIAMVERAWGL